MGESRAGVALGGVELGAGVRQGEPMGARGWVLPVWRSHAETCRLGGDGRRGREGRSMSLQVLGMIFLLSLTLRLVLPSPYSAHPIPKVPPFR